jgi:hypothetical protein
MDEKITIEVIKTTDKNKIVYVEDSKFATLYDVKDLLQQKKDIEERIAKTPSPTDEVLLSWARLNYPNYVDHSLEIQQLNKINKILELNGK